MQLSNQATTEVVVTWRTAEYFQRPIFSKKVHLETASERRLLAASRRLDSLNQYLKRWLALKGTNKIEITIVTVKKQANDGHD